MSLAPPHRSAAQRPPHSHSPVGGPRARAGSWRQWLESADRGRTCLVVLAVAMVVSIAVVLNETNGATFSTDEFLYFVVNRGFDVKTVLSPHNGNLSAVIRLLYAAVFKVAGPDYAFFRILLALEIAATAGLFYVLVRRRVGPVAALALTLPLLFLGSSADVAINTIGVQHLLCLIACLGALIALEADSRRGDVLACALLTIGVATFSIAFAFIAGAGVSVLLREDRRRRAWIFLVPLALYVLWLIAAPKYSGPGYLGTTSVQLTNLLLIPSFIANAAAALAAAVTGLSYDFWQTGPAQVVTYYTWGIPLAAVAAVALVWRVRRGGLNPWFWSYLAIPLVFWLSIVMTIEPNRYPNSDRYIYGAAVAALLLTAEALRRLRLSGGALAGLLCASAVAVTGNAAQLRVDGSIRRASSAQVRSVLTAVELARGRVTPSFLPPAPYPALLFTWAGGVDPYLEAVKRNGSFAFSVAELRRQSEGNRELADSTLAGALRIHLQPAPRFNPTARCVVIAPGARGLHRFTVRPPGAVLRSAAGGAVTVGRFGSVPTANVGVLPPRRVYRLVIPRDRSSVPWNVSVPAGVQAVCRESAG